MDFIRNTWECTWSCRDQHFCLIYLVCKIWKHHINWCNKWKGNGRNKREHKKMKSVTSKTIETSRASAALTTEAGCQHNLWWRWWLLQLSPPHHHLAALHLLSSDWSLLLCSLLVESVSGSLAWNQQSAQHCAHKWHNAFGLFSFSYVSVLVSFSFSNFDEVALKNKKNNSKDNSYFLTKKCKLACYEF